MSQTQITCVVIVVIGGVAYCCWLVLVGDRTGAQRQDRERPSSLAVDKWIEAVLFFVNVDPARTPKQQRYRNKIPIPNRYRARRSVAKRYRRPIPVVAIHSLFTFAYVLCVCVLQF